MNLKDVENLLPLPEVKPPATEESLEKALFDFVSYLQYKGVDVGWENCDHGYMTWQTITPKQLKKYISIYLKGK